jgi:hypothetical protein
MRIKSVLKIVATIAAISVIIHIQPPAANAQTFQSCLVEDEDALFIQLRERARDGYSAAYHEFDFQTQVISAWRSADVTSIIQAEAAEAGKQYGGEDFLERQINRRGTSYSEEMAEAAIKTIADQTFSTPAVQDAIESVVENSVDRFLTYLVLRSDNVAIDMGLCFSDFLSLNFPPIVQSAASQHFDSIREAVQLESPNPQNPNFELPTSAVLGSILVALNAIRRNIISKISKQVASRVITRLVSRGIPYVGWALLAYEVIAQRDGSIPEIVDSLTGPEIIGELQNEIASEINSAVSRQIPDIAQEIVRATMKDWHIFVADNETVVALSKTNPRFRRYLDQFSSNEDLAPIRDAVALIVRLGGEDALNGIIDRNQMSAVLRLSVAGQQLARETNSLEIALQWSARAPNRLDEVLVSELYRMKTPTELSEREINFLLDLPSPQVIRSAALLPSYDVQFLSQIDRVSATIFLETLPTDRTVEAVKALRSITSADARNTALRHVSGDRYNPETLIADLNAVSVSRNQNLAATLVFSSQSIIDSVFPRAVLAAIAGDVSWRLLLRAYYRELTILGLILLTIFVFGWLRRPKRQEVVIRHEKNH